jgi:hypothetical protein
MSEPMVLAVVGVGLIAAAILADSLDGFRRRRGESSSEDADA